MTAQDYADKYSISWRYSRQPYQAKIWKYLAMDKSICSGDRINGAQAAKSMLTAAAKKTEGVEERGPAFNAANPDGPPMLVEHESIRKSFAGKGSPTDLESTLWLATRVGQITSDPAKIGRQCTLAQQYADWYLGMDCSGFAMNYLGLHCQIQDLDRGHQPERRKELADIKPNDAMIVCRSGDYHHIALVTFTAMHGDVMRVHSVESLGGHVAGISGLVGICTQYRDFVKKAPGIFQEKQPGKGVIATQEFYFQPVSQRGQPVM